MRSLICVSATVILTAATISAADWTISSQEDWQQVVEQKENLVLKDGLASPTGKMATFRSKLKRFDAPKSAKSIVIEQSPVWQNWNPVPNVGPSNLGDAPVMLSIAPGNYWMFGRYNGGNKRKNFQSEPATVEGYDVPLVTTPFPHQFDAPGGLKPGKGGYHAWQSHDMKTWVHHGPVTEGFSKWVTSAEYVDGKTYIYYDYPNDQDPHVYVDSDLTDGLLGDNKGKAFDDPSDGSDAGFIRDEQGKMHVIYEDWSPINASKRSWDSPLAGHAVSKDGISNYQILSPAIDNRTKATGEVKTYKHPHWLQHPDFKTNIAKYNVHEPEQEAYGDWAPICIGGRYYLFGDYDPIGGHAMSVGWFTSPSLDEEFVWCDHVGNGHPDPDIGFAEGRFYLVTQQQTDFVSPGPWVDGVSVRVGVDT
ncbi:MAG: hypothetical protein HUJ26_08355, partial [Planctomycetaceae bacterium]|nr:hypothetical protein [Planctomycetaceae bacterium]